MYSAITNQVPVQEEKFNLIFFGLTTIVLMFDVACTDLIFLKAES